MKNREKTALEITFVKNKNLGNYYGILRESKYFFFGVRIREPRINPTPVTNKAHDKKVIN